MLEYLWYAVGWVMGWAIVVGFRGLIWVMDMKNVAHDGWKRVTHTHSSGNAPETDPAYSQLST